MKIRDWLINKLAGDRLVVINATMLYKYFPIFADIEKKPIIENCKLVQHDQDTPFLVYANHIFDIKGTELKINTQYEDAYNEVIKDIEAEQTKQSSEIEEGTEQ